MARTVGRVYAKRSDLANALQVEALKENVNISARHANKLIKTLMGAIDRVLVEKGNVFLPGIGRINFTPRPERRYYSVNDGQRKIAPPSVKISISATKALKGTAVAFKKEENGD